MDIIKHLLLSVVYVQQIALNAKIKQDTAYCVSIVFIFFKIIVMRNVQLQDILKILHQENANYVPQLVPYVGNLLLSANIVNQDII